MKIKKDIQLFVANQIAIYGLNPDEKTKVAITKQLLDATGDCLLGVKGDDDLPTMKIKRGNYEFTITAKPVTNT